jgi:hypothetical protein
MRRNRSVVRHIRLRRESGTGIGLAQEKSAKLVQSVAFRHSPMAAVTAQKLIRVLGILVDMGDRGSTALQISDPLWSVQRDDASS